MDNTLLKGIYKFMMPVPPFLYRMLISHPCLTRASSMYFESSRYSSGQKNMQKTSKEH